MNRKRQQIMMQMVMLMMAMALMRMKLFPMVTAMALMAMALNDGLGGWPHTHCWTLRMTPKTHEALLMGRMWRLRAKMQLMKNTMPQIANNTFRAQHILKMILIMAVMVMLTRMNLWKNQMNE